MNGRTKNIDFICIGAAKSGTTWLYDRLAEQQGFVLPPVKEIHYWDRSDLYPSPSVDHLTKIATWPLTKKYIKLTIKGQWDLLQWYKKWHQGTISDEWYSSLFSSSDYTGDITPAYSILSVSDIKRMYQLAPTAKIIFMIRNPIDRAWSHFRHQMRLHGDPESSALTFINSQKQLLRSNYLQTISNYSKVYPQGSIMIAFYDAIKDQPEKLLREIMTFITGSDAYNCVTTNLSKKSNYGIPLAPPDAVQQQLIAKYSGLITELDAQYGSYCTEWKNDLKSTSTKESIPPTATLII